MAGKVKDCGCGGGKNCITKAKAISAYKESHPNTRLTGAILASVAQKWSKNEMERLDCGCGCKGLKGFAKKYLKGGKLNDCPPGFDNHGLTCLERCGPDEFDDGLTCRKKCGPGLIDDGLTCRKPITSSMNSCPAGSRDIAGTCWGPVRRDCIDDCFKHPAPGCKTHQCGRLRGLFGEDWGPKLCTSCNLRCGQTCWDVQGITKQLHQRDLKVMGGEVYGQAIRGKRIIGRVDWDATLKEIEGGLNNFFSDNGPLAKAFDPAKNGVNAAFEKFGKDTEAAFKAIGEKIQKGFDEMGAAAKSAFEDLGRRMKADFEKLGVDILHKLKDPYFWADFVSYSVMVLTVILTAAATVATGGLAAPAMPGLLAAAALIGPAIRMTADGINGKPIDVLDVVEFGLSLATALIPAAGPGVSVGMKTLINVGKGAVIAGKVAVACTRVVAKFGFVDTCIANCPGMPPGDPPIDPPIPRNPPPPAKTDEEIEKLIDACYKTRVTLRGPPPRHNPDNCGTTEEGIEKWRRDNEAPVPPETPQEKAIREAREAAEAAEAAKDAERNAQPPKANDDDVEDDDFPPGFPAPRPAPPPPASEPAEEDDDDFPPGFPRPKPAPSAPAPPPAEAAEEDEDDFPPGFPRPKPAPSVPPSGSGMRRRRGGAVARIEDAVVAEKVNDREYKNPWTDEMAGIKNNSVPLDQFGEPFNPECYAKNYPDIASQLNNDMTRLTTWWTDIGHAKGDNPNCNYFIKNLGTEYNECKKLNQNNIHLCDKYKNIEEYIKFVKKEIAAGKDLEKIKEARRLVDEKEIERAKISKARVMEAEKRHATRVEVIEKIENIEELEDAVAKQKKLLNDIPKSDDYYEERHRDEYNILVRLERRLEELKNKNVDPIIENKRTYESFMFGRRTYTVGEIIDEGFGPQRVMGGDSRDGPILARPIRFMPDPEGGFNEIPIFPEIKRGSGKLRKRKSYK